MLSTITFGYLNVFCEQKKRAGFKPRTVRDLTQSKNVKDRTAASSLKLLSWTFPPTTTFLTIFFVDSCEKISLWIKATSLLLYFRLWVKQFNNWDNLPLWLSIFWLNFFSTFLILALGFAGTMIFYWFAQSDQYRDILAKPIITSLYHRYQWRWLRKEHAMEVFLFKCRLLWSVSQ